MSDPILRVLSLGAGRQSTALYLLCCDGEFGDARPTVAIFADTQDEPADVYRHLDRLERDFGHILPIRRVTAGRLRDAFLSGKGTNPPFFVRAPDGSRGVLYRNCTRDYKIRPIEREIRKLAGLRKGQRFPAGQWVESWQGISLDEVSRMKDNKNAWAKNRYPLVFDHPMSADQCATYNARRGYPAVKSACTYCPYTDRSRLRDMRDNRPEEWADAVAIDRQIRHGIRGVELPVFMNDSLVPLDEVDLSTDADRGQPNLFENECEGMCGV